MFKSVNFAFNSESFCAENASNGYYIVLLVQYEDSIFTCLELALYHFQNNFSISIIVVHCPIKETQWAGRILSQMVTSKGFTIHKSLPNTKLKTILIYLNSCFILYFYIILSIPALVFLLQM